MKRATYYGILCLFLTFINNKVLLAQEQKAASNAEVLQNMLELLKPEVQTQIKAGRWLAELNDPTVVPAFLDAMYLIKYSDPVHQYLQQITGQKIGIDWPKWMEWLGRQDIAPHRAYLDFKQILYTNIDSEFSKFLVPVFESKIRWDEIVWGGVKKDGIPALTNPVMISGQSANYLKSKDEIFGIKVNGKSHAYPLKILNWHEMLNGVIGGESISLSYCVLCGSAVLYFTQEEKVNYTFGTSGLLYRSNKLMYDHQTNSLWSQIKGEPVLGPLVNKNIKMKRGAVARTTWQKWLKQNPTTLVPDIKTGFDRDYKKNSAYKNYFKSSDTMFPVPWRDKRLDAKDWVFGLILNNTQKAYPLKFLKKKKVITDIVGGKKIVLLINAKSLSVRAYASKSTNFETLGSENTLVDRKKNIWSIAEDFLILESNPEIRLERLPGHLSYWFAWYAFFRDTLIWEKD